MWKKLLIILGITLLTGCSTEKSIIPKIDSSPRTGVHLSQPLMISVFDSRVNNGNDNVKSRESLTASLTNIYGENIQWISDFDKVPSGRVAVRIRLITLGANFGSRIVSSSSYENAVYTARASATDGWGTVVGVSEGNSTVNSAAISTEGWWNGAAWVDFIVEDHTNPQKIEFTVPLVAEHQENNTWGYSSGVKATEVAWNSVSVQILRSIDAVLRKMSN